MDELKKFPLPSDILQTERIENTAQTQARGQTHSQQSRVAVVSLPDRLRATVVQLSCLERNGVDVGVLLRELQLETEIG